MTALTRLFAGRPLGPEFPESRATESAPQPQEPPKLVVGVMRWMPKPSIRTLLILAAVVAGVAIHRRKSGAAPLHLGRSRRRGPAAWSARLSGA
jgi:hypothetical protein